MNAASVANEPCEPWASGRKGTVVSHDRRLAVIGLGYVGLPVAVAFGRQGTAFGGQRR